MKMRNKGKVYPSPSSSSSMSSYTANRDSLSVLKVLPAAILALVSVLSLEDREVLAYMITRSMKSTNPSAIVEEKKKNKKSNTHKPPIFDCECFDCYTSFWFRWDSSPNRELIHQAIEAFEEHLASEEQSKKNTRDEGLSMAMFKKPNLNMYRLMNGPSLQPSGWFEIRLFYVRIAPCAVETVPDHLTLRHLRREIGVSLEINGTRIPSSETTSLSLRRDRLDKESLEVTYVSTDCVKVSGAVEFEVYEKEDMMLCGSLERMEAVWSNGNVGLDNDSKTGWGMDCYMSASIGSGGSAFFQPKFGISAPLFEVYIAGCCSGVPVILTKTIQISPRRKLARHNTLDAIPEDAEIGKEQKINNGLVRQRKVQITEAEVEDYESDGKIGSNYYSEDTYAGEDGELSWFNAGVRVGVGIGLGMCLGVGIGVGLMMRSYQATTRTFRRRFF